MKKVFRTLLISMLISASMSTIAFAEQSSRWYEQSGVWYLKNEQGTGNQTGWFQDLDQSWYMLDSTDGHMYAGLVHDTSTDKWYYCETEHQGHYGRMAVTDGVYSVNGQSVYIAFNKSHDGTYGAITSGLSELQKVGVPTTNTTGLTSGSTTNQNANQQTPPKKEDKKDNTSNPVDDTLRDAGITDEMMKDIIDGSTGQSNYGSLE